MSQSCLLDVQRIARGKRRQLLQPVGMPEGSQGQAAPHPPWMLTSERTRVLKGRQTLTRWRIAKAVPRPLEGRRPSGLARQSGAALRLPWLPRILTGCQNSWRRC
jgi:hypothetical protein